MTLKDLYKLISRPFMGPNIPSTIDKAYFIPDEEQPSFVGGEKAMMEFIRHNIEYPVDAIKNNIQGTVYVEFIVEPDGSLTGTYVKTSAHWLLNEPAKAVINKMPKWIPGRNKGIAVKVRVSIPIKFRIKTV